MKQANSKTIKYDYNKLDQLLKVDYSEKSDGNVLYTYDTDGRRVSMNDLTGQTNYAYDADGKITGVKQGDGSLIKYDYDKYGNIQELTYADGSKVKYRYDELDRLTQVIDKDNKKTTYQYDDAGNMTLIKRSDGTSSEMRYRLDNRVEKITHLDKKGKVISSYGYDYDADNQISEEIITQDGETVVQTYQYDSLGQISQMTVYDKDKKHEKASYSYSYDHAGNKLTSTERIGDQKEVTRLTYDDNNRLVSQTTQKTKASSSEVSKEKEEKIQARAITTEETPEKSEEETTPSDSVTSSKTITFTYDKNGNRIKKEGDDSNLEYIYDTENRLLAVKDKEGLLQAALYDGDNNRVFTASRENGKTAYQLFSRKEKQESPKTSTKGSGNSLFWFGFSENVIQGFSSLSDTMGNFWVDTFETISQAYHQKIAKDRANQEGVVVNPPELGNRPGEGDVTYASEVKDVLIPYTTREDSYHYFETRNYVNDVNQENTQVLQTYDEELKPREHYTYGNERISYENSQTKDSYQYLSDARGSVTGMTQDGNSVASHHYDVYGKPSQEDKTGNPYGYTGEAQDPTGLNYLRARYYDSQSGTFTSQDSYEGEQDNPLSQNGYSYVENNPINYTDPTGHKKNIFQKAWGWTKKTASNAWSATKRVASNVWNGTKKVVNNVVNWVGNQVNNVTNWVSNTWNGVKQTVGNAWNNAKNYLANRPNYQPQYGPYNTYYPISGGYSGSSGYVSAAQQQAIQTAIRQQRISNEYSKATGNTGKPKTKEGKNIFKNWGKSLENTYKKFCQTADKVKEFGKSALTSVGAFGTGFFIQAFENNGLTAEEGSRLRNFSEQDWIQNNPGYNWGVFSGKLSGILQAGGEYFASAAIFTGGNGLSIVASPVTGGASLTASPAATAGAAAVAAHGTLVWQSTIQSFANNSNYGSGGSSSTPESLGYKKTNERSHGQAVYKNSKGKPKYITKDVDSHNGGAWKGADSVKDLGSKKTRTGTYDSKLNRIGD